MGVFNEECKSHETRKLKHKLAAYKRERVRLLERGDTKGAEEIERRIEDVRVLLGRAEERAVILKTELRDIEYLCAFHTLEEFYGLLERNTITKIQIDWGVSYSELKRWAAQEEETKMLDVQTMAAEVVATHKEGQQQQQLQAEIELLRENFNRVQKELRHAQDMLQREKVRTASREATIRELEEEVDAYAEMVGELEHYKKLASLAAKHFVGELSDAAYTKAVAELAMYQVMEG